MGKKMNKENKNTKIKKDKGKEKEEKTKKTKEIKRQKEIEIGKEMEKEKKIKKELNIGNIKKIENINVYYNIDNIIQENKEKLIELQKENKLNALLFNSYLNMSLDKKKKEKEAIIWLKEKKEKEKEKENEESSEIEISSKTVSINSKKNKQPPTPSVDSSDTEGLKQKFEDTKYDLKKIVEEMNERNKNHYKKKYEFERKKLGPESERIDYEVTTAIKKIEDANRKRREREERRKQTEKQFVICKECKKKLHPHSRNYHIFTSHNGKDLDKKIKQTCLNRLISKKMDTIASIMKEITTKKKEHGLEIQNANFVKIAQILNIEI
jgi:hypothetical protein